jgi:sphingolipid 4-desaturase/C4-monooxygenase
VLAKTVYGLLYLVVYGVRPLVVRPKAVTTGDIINWAVVMTCNAAVLYFWGFKSLVYLLAGSLLGGGLHPLAGHLIAEHYMFEAGQETYSYYGPLNAISYNVGYHNEHHDFPQIPQTRLHKLREIAPEFYSSMYCHHSWTWVIARFLFDPTVGPWSRMHRVKREGTAEGNAAFIATNCQYGAVGKGATEGAKARPAAKHAREDSAMETELLS